MQNNIEFKLVKNFICKKCGCTTYDKLIYTGIKTLNDDNSIICEKYVCRNCDFPININEYLNSIEENISMKVNELLNNSIFIDEGVSVKNNDKINKKENTNNE